MAISHALTTKIAILNFIRDTYLQDPQKKKRFRLFVNDVNLTARTTTSALIEASFTGYSSVLTSSLRWTTPAANANDDAQVVADPFTYTYAGEPSQTVYGWYVTDVNNNYVFGEKTFPAGLLFSTPGQFITINPRFLYGDFVGSQYARSLH